jgi:glycosyltransferase 2 family protein
VLNGVAQPQAVAATVLIRLATLWFAVALGIIALTLPEREKR